MTQTNLTKKLKGYHKHFRGRFLMLRNQYLNEHEYVLWDLGFSVLADWDKDKHPDIYGSFNFTQEQMGLLIGWNKSKVNRWSKSLLSKKLWEKKQDGRISVRGYEIIENLADLTKTVGVINLQTEILKLQPKVAEMQQNVPEMQPESPKENALSQDHEVAKMQPLTPKEALVLCKGNYVDSLKKEEEYQQIQNEGDYQYLTISDMKWIDQNIKER